MIKVVEESAAELPITKSHELKWSKDGWVDTELVVVKFRVLVNLSWVPELTKLTWK